MVFYGESQCQFTVKSSGKRCTNKTYFKSLNMYGCGVHTKKDKLRIKLNKNPNAKQKREEELKRRADEIQKIANQNKLNKVFGHVIVSKFRMMKQPVYKQGYLNVFPNFKHQYRKDGFGCARLSPKSLGPVIHTMPNLPPALNIENYHQGAKFWKFELNESGDILEPFIKKRIEMYKSNVPIRHKYDRKTLRQFNRNINIPCFSVYYTKKGEEKRYNYLQCRYFYCHYYERLAKKENDFKILVDFIRNGYNLNIVGYDGYPVRTSLWDMYIDTSKPFGHEMVLYTLLVEKDPNNYPWNVFYNKNKNIYKDVI